MLRNVSGGLLLILLFLGLLPSPSSSPVRMSATSIAFDTSSTDVTDRLSFWILNEGPDTIFITDINSFEGVFAVRDTSRVIMARETSYCTVEFSSANNLTYRDILLIENRGAAGTLAVKVSGTKRYVDTTYSRTQGLSGDSLKASLAKIISRHTVLGFDRARDTMFLSLDRAGDSLECVYTGRKIKVTNRSDMETNGKFVTKYSWPQSTIPAQQDSARSDLHHLFPIDAAADRIRANYPFGTVTGNSTWSVGGSKLGSGPGGVTVFEPRAAHKGDVARAMFYFIIRYSNYSNYWNQGFGTMEATFRQWHKLDPPSLKESRRNTAIGSFPAQRKRNPFVDHPEFVERVGNFAGASSTLRIPSIVVSPLRAVFDIVPAGEVAAFRVAVVNKGTSLLRITSVSSSKPVFRIQSFPLTIAAKDVGYIDMRFEPDRDMERYEATLTIRSNDVYNPAITVELKGETPGVTSVRDGSRVPEQTFRLREAFPNPFNGTVHLQFECGMVDRISVVVFDIEGRKVESLMDETEVFPGEQMVRWDAGERSTGVYLVRMSSARSGMTATKKVVLVR